MDVVATHEITFGEGTVTKRFIRWDRGEHQREWRALGLLDAHRPGLAPGPIASGLLASPPYVVMSYVAGNRVGADGSVDGARLLDALAAGLTTLHHAVPGHELQQLPSRMSGAGQAVDHLRACWTVAPSPSRSVRR
jgi:hypothetical protein